MLREVNIRAKKRRIMDRKISKSEELHFREIDILSLLAQGLINEDIASTLNISVRSVEDAIRKAKRETGIHNRVLLAFYAYGKGYVTAETINTAIEAQRKEEKE